MTDELDPRPTDEAPPAGPHLDAPRLSTPRLVVTLDDGRELTVQARNPDYLRWDRTASKHGWPTMQKAPFLWLTFIAWSALRREGQIPDSMTWEAFSEVHALQVTAPAGTAGGNGVVDGVDPTLLAAGPG